MELNLHFNNKLYVLPCGVLSRSDTWLYNNELFVLMLFLEVKCNEKQRVLRKTL